MPSIPQGSGRETDLESAVDPREVVGDKGRRKVEALHPLVLEILRARDHAMRDEDAQTAVLKCGVGELDWWQPAAEAGQGTRSVNNPHSVQAAERYGAGTDRVASSRR